MGKREREREMKNCIVKNYTHTQIIEGTDKKNFDKLKVVDFRKVKRFLVDFFLIFGNSLWVSKTNV